MSANLYSRVYHLPERLAGARDKVRACKRRIDWLGESATFKDRASLTKLENRLRSYENEARQYKFWDLLE